MVQFSHRVFHFIPDRILTRVLSVLVGYWLTSVSSGHDRVEQAMRRVRGAWAIGSLAAAALFALALLAQPAWMGSRTLTFRSSADNSEQPYALFLPRDFDAALPHPLLISLHAEDTTSVLNLPQVLGLPGPPFLPGRAARNLDPRRPGADFIVACPFARGTMGYRGIAESDVYDVLADVKRRYSIDEDRVYLTGVSMGGGGALWYALTRPDIGPPSPRFALPPFPAARNSRPMR